MEKKIEKGGEKESEEIQAARKRALYSPLGLLIQRASNVGTVNKDKG